MKLGVPPRRALRKRAQARAAYACTLLTAACVTRADLGHWSPSEAAQVTREPDAAVSGSTDGSVKASRDLADSTVTSTSANGVGVDAGAVPVSACSRAGSVAGACALTNGSRLPADLTGDPLGTVRWFADGAPLPSGRYRIEYIDGCVRYISSVFPDQSGVSGYTVQATTSDSAMGLGAFWLIAADLTLVTMTPGTAGVLIGRGSSELYGAYATYEACVEANCALPAREFTFAGGNLALSNSSIPPPESVAAFVPGQRAPTFRLSYLDDCTAASEHM